MKNKGEAHRSFEEIRFGDDIPGPSSPPNEEDLDYDFNNLVEIDPIEFFRKYYDINLFTQKDVEGFWDLFEGVIMEDFEDEE